MDPLSLEAQRFTAELALGWREIQSHGPSALRLEVLASDRKEMVKALRLAEWDPDNRRPLIRTEAPFDTAESFLSALAQVIERSYEELAMGLQSDGMEIPPLDAPKQPITTGEIASLLRRAAEGVQWILEGLDVALIPTHVDDPEGYASLVGGLSRISDGSRLRIMVLDDPALPETIRARSRFVLDSESVRRYAQNLADAKGRAPGSPKPWFSPKQKLALERDLGYRLPSEATGESLRILLFEAGEAMRKGQPGEAARRFRRAAMLCNLSGLEREGVAVGIALGTATFASGETPGAVAAYQKAKQEAVGLELPLLAAQAELGVAAVRFASRDYASAHVSYGEVARLAEQAAPLRLEALRMQAECLREGGHAQGAIDGYGGVLAAAEGLSPSLRRSTCVDEAGRTLVSLLLAQGETQRAGETERRLARLREGGVQ